MLPSTYEPSTTAAKKREGMLGTGNMFDFDLNECKGAPKIGAETFFPTLLKTVVLVSYYPGPGMILESFICNWSPVVCLLRLV